MLVIYWLGKDVAVIGESFENKAQCEYYANYKNQFNKPKNVREFKCVEFIEVKTTK